MSQTPTSAARIAANQANAQRSTGPTTEAGKLRSRANALKHGLTATVVSVEDEATVQARLVGVVDTVRPQNEFQFWLCGKIAQTTVKLDRLAVIEQETRAEAAHRAKFCWEEDQNREANRIAARLARHPGWTVGLLRRSVAGCDWLIDRWSQLAESAETKAWTEEQIRLAHDLLGTPAEFRDRAPTHQVDQWGQAVTPKPTELDLACAHLTELHDHRDRVLAADERAQTRAMADLDDFQNRDLGRLRHYERRLWNDLNAAFAMSQHDSPHLVANPRFLRSIPDHLMNNSPAPTNEPNLPPAPTPTPDPEPGKTNPTPPPPRVESGPIEPLLPPIPPVRPSQNVAKGAQIEAEPPRRPQLA